MKVSVARMEQRGIRGNVRHDNRVNASVVVKLFPDCDLRPFPQGDFLRGATQGDFLRGVPQGDFLRGATQGDFLRGAPQGDFLRGAPQGDFLRGAFGLLAGLTA
jgi:hypothetical protein